VYTFFTSEYTHHKKSFAALAAIWDLPPTYLGEGGEMHRALRSLFARTATATDALNGEGPADAPPVAVGVAVGAAPKPAKHSLPAEGARWMVTVEIDGEAISEPWVMEGGVPKHDVAHCCKPDGLASADAQSKRHQVNHTLACLKRHAKKTQAAAAAAETAAAKELSTSLAKAAMAAAAQAKEQEDAKEAEERQQKRARDKAAGKPLDMSAATQTGMGAFFAKRPKPAAGSSPATAAAAGPCTPAPARSPPPTTAGPSPTAATTGSPPTATGPPPGKSPAPASEASKLSRLVMPLIAS
jgi:hypothetical protein